MQNAANWLVEATTAGRAGRLMAAGANPVSPSWSLMVFDSGLEQKYR